jgi:hypothetical protein
MTLARTALPPDTATTRTARPRAPEAPVETRTAPALEKQALPAAVQEALLPPFHAAVNRIEGPEEKAAAAGDVKGDVASTDPAPANEPFWRNPIVWSAVILAVALIGIALVAYGRRPRRIFKT